MALILPAPAWSARHAPPPRAASPAAEADPAASLGPSPTAMRVADWIALSRDNGALPYAIVDKQGALLLLFDAARKLIGTAPVLVGVAPGDDATPGIGSKSLARIGPAEKTTPAGRFLARYGWAAGRQRVLWVDYATSVALHPIPKDAAPSERRRARMLSAAPEDHRITFGCINVPTAFYNRSVRPLFGRKGGYVYVLPDTKPIETVFPGLLTQPFLAASPTTAEAGLR